MEDDKSTEATNNEETQATDLSLDSINFDDDSETTESESQNNTEKADTEQHEDEEESEDDADESEHEESTEESEEAEKPDKSQMSDEQVKEHNRQMAERRIAEKQAREKSLGESQEDYLAQAENDQDLAVRQLQVQAYNNHVKSNTSTLTNEYQRALNEFEILRSDDPVIKAAVDKAIDSFQARNVTVDAYGNPSDVRESLYEYLQTEAEHIQALTGIGARKQVQAKSKEKSKAFTPPSRSPKTKSDPLMDVLLAD